ncbi:hypothetical protein [Methylocapsa palsarum]|uniref:hypothetical protein n=1 Tax=Methylocapsa palsarum TaxID=1612308 RepID=UPI001FCE0C55|nr:hypothetical protein [Methylocapsa palsarum]
MQPLQHPFVHSIDGIVIFLPGGGQRRRLWVFLMRGLRLPQQELICQIAGRFSHVHVVLGLVNLQDATNGIIGPHIGDAAGFGQQVVNDVVTNARMKLLRLIVVFVDNRNEAHQSHVIITWMVAGRRAKNRSEKPSQQCAGGPRNAIHDNRRTRANGKISSVLGFEICADLRRFMGGGESAIGVGDQFALVALRNIGRIGHIQLAESIIRKGFAEVAAEPGDAAWQKGGADAVLKTVAHILDGRRRKQRLVQCELQGVGIAGDRIIAGCLVPNINRANIHERRIAPPLTADILERRIAVATAHDNHNSA